MALIVTAVVGIAGLSGFVLILRNYRRQDDFQEGPGKVPEDYS